MCSNRTADIYGSCSTSSKAKKPRIPKRGPGVAELEKILLREQGKGNITIGIGGIPSSMEPSNSTARRVTYLRSTPSPRTSHFHPPTLHVNGTGDPMGSSQFGGENVCGNGPSKGVYISGSGLYLPEKTLLPVTWVSSDQNMFHPHMLQTNHGPCVHPSMIGINQFKEMSFFPGSAVSSSSTPSSARVYHRVEPPSTQKSCHNYTSTTLQADQDCQITGAKRLRPDFNLDTPCQPPPFHPRIQRLNHSYSSINNDVVFNLGRNFRDDSMPSSPLELIREETCVNDEWNHNENDFVFTLGSPTTSLPKFIKRFPFQEMEKTCEDQRGATATATATAKGLTVLDLMNKEKYHCTENTCDFIDLNLKL